MMEGMSNWQHNLNWLDDDDDQDSDTDSKLSGSAAADSVLRHLSRRQPYKQANNEFSLDTMKEQDEEEAESVEAAAVTPEELRDPARAMSNGYHHHTPVQQHRDLVVERTPPQPPRNLGSNSPQFKQRNYENTQLPSSYPYANHILSPVPETTSGGARVVEISVPPSQYPPIRKSSFTGSGTRSMENVSRGTPPSRRRRNYEPHLPNGRPHYRDVRIPHTNGLGNSSPHSRSQEHLSHPGGVYPGDLGVGGVAYRGEVLSDDALSDVHVPHQQSHYPYHKTSVGGIGGGGMQNLGLPGPGLIPHSNSISSHSSGRVPNPSPHYRSMSIGSASSVPAPSHSSPSHSYSKQMSKTPPQRRANYTRHEIKREPHQAALQTSGPAGMHGEPNLQDVVQFLRSGDKTLVSNAASYLQHLAYGDDNMKTKIRDHGAIPVLMSLIRHQDTKVQITVLGALKNLSYGRATDANKHVIANDHSLMEIMMALKNSRVSEVRELLTALLWNLSSCEALKLKMMKACLHDLVQIVMVTYTGWNTEDSREPTARPHRVMWNAELKNTTGALRNISSAGEPARQFMRSTTGMVDTLLWLLKAGVQQKTAADEKTVENTVCILRNLSYRLESEVDPQEGGEDVLDREWEQEQRRDMDDLNKSFSKSSPGCLAFCARPRTRDDVPKVTLTNVARPVCSVDFVRPDASAMPKRRKPVYGKSLLWQPEVAFAYLAVTEQYPDCVDAVEAAAGAIQNLTACNWKWAVYIRNIIRTSNGLHLLTDLLNNGHDVIVRAAATTLQNLSSDQRNRVLLGVQAITNIIPRLPLSSNHLGISEDTSVALLCCLMELFTSSPENAKLFRDKDGITLLTRLTRSRQHTTKVTFAAQKACSLLWEYKDTKSALKKVGWDISHFTRLAKEMDIQFDFDSQGSISRDYQGSRRGKKQGSKRSSGTKKSKKKEKDEIGFIAGGLPAGDLAQMSPTQTSPSGLSSTTSDPNPSHFSAHSATPTSHQQQQHSPQVIEEPNYQTIPSPAPPPSVSLSQANTSPPLIEPNYQSVPDPTSPGNASSSTGGPASSTGGHAPSSSSYPSGPTIIYQSIEDTTGKSSSSVVETAPSTTNTSGPLSVTSQEPEAEEQPEFDPNATYASVDIEKKRASRRIKEQQKIQQQQQQPEVDENIDSWV